VLVLTVLIIFILFLLAAGTFCWAFNGMRTHFCPLCRANEDMDENLVPIVPLMRWWCPACSHVFKHSEVAAERKGPPPQESEDRPPSLL
jgi:hypothetical protein